MTRACLSDEELTRCVEGSAEAHGLDALLEHIEGCPDCGARFRRACESAETFDRGAASLSPLDRELLGRIQESPPDPTAASDAGDYPTIPGFEIEAEIGEGGQAVVYRARQSRIDGRTVALKLLGSSHRALLRAHLTRFRNEATALSRLEHPNIVRLYDVAEHEDFSYLILEYVDGGTLRDRLDRQRFNFAEAAEFVEGLASATHFAHERGIIHRDLKPRNILLTKAGIPKISDFGLARLLEYESDVTLSHQPLGTKEYMSPEQALGRIAELGPGTDVYSLGTILYQVLTGRPPFVGNDWSELLSQIRDDDPIPPRSLRPGLPRDLQTICLKCLRKRPGDRYQTARELAEDLRAFLEGRPLRARPPGPAERAAKFVRRNRSLVAVVLALLVGLVGTTSFAVWALDSRRKMAQADLARRSQYARSKIENGDYHASRGDWDRAIQVLEEATRLDAGPPGEAHLRLARIHAHRSDLASARRHLSLARGSLGDSAAVLLTEAMLTESDGGGARQAERALAAGELVGADAEYAAALTSRTLQDALSHLDATLREQPYHLSAARNRVGLLMLCGRFREARDQASGLQVFYPEDRTFVIVDALEAAALGDSAKAEAVLEEIDDQLSSETLAGVTALTRVIARLARLQLDSPEPSLDQMNSAVLEVIRSSLTLAAVKSEQGIGLTLPPGLREAYQGLPANIIGAGTSGLLARMFGSQSTSGPPVRELVRAHRDAFTLHLLGRVLVQEGRFEEAQEVFQEACESSSLFDMRRANHFLAARCRFQRYRFGDLPPDQRARLREGLLKNLSALLDLGETLPSRFYYCGEFAWQFGDGDLLARVADHWRKAQPESAGPDLLMAYYHHGRKRYLAAYEYAQEAGKKEIPREFAQDGQDFAKEVRETRAICLKELEKRGVRLSTDEKDRIAPEKPR